VSRSHRIPGPTSFWEVVAIPPERFLWRKVIRRAERVSLWTDNRNRTAEWNWRNSPVAFSHHKMG
jgi:hypothetical protein